MCMNLARVCVEGPEWADVDDLINNAREAIARRGYQVGEWGRIVPTGKGRIEMNLEIEERLFEEVADDVVGAFTHNDFRVTWVGEHKTPA